MQSCTARVDYRVDSIGRDFGTVMLAQSPGAAPQSVSRLVVRAGWARVRGSADAAAQAPDLDELRDEEAAAAAAERGIHTTDARARAASTFMFDADSAAIAADFIQARGKGVPIPAVVDAVMSGTTVKVVTLPDRAVLLLALAGAQSPAVRRGADGTLEGEPYGLQVRPSRSFVRACCALGCH